MKRKVQVLITRVFLIDLKVLRMVDEALLDTRLSLCFQVEVAGLLPQTQYDVVVSACVDLNDSVLSTIGEELPSLSINTTFSLSFDDSNENGTQALESSFLQVCY